MAEYQTWPAYCGKKQFQKVWLRLKENYSSKRADKMKNHISDI